MNQVIDAPRTLRQMLLAFGLYEAEAGLASMLARIDFDGVTRRQIYFSTLGRGPERGALAVDGENFRARHATTQALQGDEFQARIRENVLAAFPEKRRLVFVHVPKCAGSDLLVTLRRRYPYLHNHISIPEITAKPALFDWLRQLAIGIPLSDAIAISGHVPLRWYTERALIRFEDEVFTSLRHPRDMIYSYVSFILTRFVEFPDARRTDVRGWLAEIGMDRLDPAPSAAYLAELGGKLLRARPPNLICNFLGKGTAASALDAMVATDIEVTDMARYSAWRRQKFGFEPQRRINPSRPLFTPETASAADCALIEEKIAEDLVVYEAVTAKLAAQDGLSIRGRVLG